MTIVLSHHYPSLSQQYAPSPIVWLMLCQSRQLILIVDLLVITLFIITLTSHYVSNCLKIRLWLVSIWCHSRYCHITRLSLVLISNHIHIRCIIHIRYHRSILIIILLNLNTFNILYIIHHKCTHIGLLWLYFLFILFIQIFNEFIIMSITDTSIT